MCGWCGNEKMREGRKKAGSWVRLEVADVSIRIDDVEEQK
jgi:hypothetical protein